MAFITSKLLNQKIKASLATAKNQRDNVQEILTNLAYQAMFHRNTDPAITFFAGIGKGVNVQGMSKWLSLNAPIHFADEKPTLSDSRQKANDLTELEFEQTLAITPKWYEINASQNIAVNAWDNLAFSKKIADYLLQAEKKAEKKDTTLSAKIHKIQLAMASLVTELETAEKAKIETSKAKTTSKVKTKQAKVLVENSMALAMVKSLEAKGLKLVA